MNEDMIFDTNNITLTKNQPDVLCKFKEIDISKFRPVDIVPSWIENYQNQFNNIVVSTPEERAKPITDRLDKEIDILGKQLKQAEIVNTELQDKLDKANFELKQLNDKESCQRLELKELRADLKEEILKRELAETKLSVKDWKTICISFVSGMIVTILGGIILYLIT